MPVPERLSSCIIQSPSCHADVASWLSTALSVGLTKSLGSPMACGPSVKAQLADAGLALCFQKLRSPTAPSRPTPACRRTSCGCRPSASGTPRASPLRAQRAASTCPCAQTSCRPWLLVLPPADTISIHLSSVCSSCQVPPNAQRGWRHILSMPLTKHAQRTALVDKSAGMLIPLKTYHGGKSEARRARLNSQRMCCAFEGGVYRGGGSIHIQNAPLLPSQGLHILGLCGGVGVGLDLVDRVAGLGRPRLCMLGVVLCPWPWYAYTHALHLSFTQMTKRPCDSTAMHQAKRRSWRRTTECCACTGILCCQPCQPLTLLKV